MLNNDLTLVAHQLAQAEARTSPESNPDTYLSWPNIHAPEAARAPTSANEAPAGRRRAIRVFLGNPTAAIGLLLLGFVVLVALTASLTFPGDPLAMAGRPLLWPGQNPHFPLGTDSLGRDVLAGLVHGAQISLLIGTVATVLSLVAGTVVGAVAGYFGGRTDAGLVKVIEVFQTVPGFILLIVVVAIAEPSIPVITVAIALVSWPPIARLVRAEFRTLREADFVMAARGMGFGHTRIMIVEILPNALPPVIVMASVTVATAILMESALSFMGLGDPNVVSWGSMIGVGREMLRTAWFLTAIPGFAIVITVLALNFIGDGLTEAFNPRLASEA